MICQRHRLHNAEAVSEVLVNIIEASSENSEDINIDAIQKTFDNIVSVGSSSVQVTENMVESVNYILATETSSSSANTSSLILQSVEQQIAQTLAKHEHVESYKTNIAIQGLTLPAGQRAGRVGFRIRSTDDGLERGNVRSRGETSSIQLPNVAFARDTDTKISFIAYNDDKLFQSERVEESNSTVVLGPVISAFIIGKESKNLSQPVVIHIAHTPDNDTINVLNTSTCVYWDFSLRSGIGDWAEDGCELVAADTDGVTCHCNHLTNFAILVDFAGQGERTTGDRFPFILDIISKVGCAVSIVCLCLTLMIFLCCSDLRISLQRKILIQFCLSMLCLYLSFLIGIDSNSEIGCLIAGLLLHYFVLSTIFWMGVEARHMYITLVSDSDRVSRRFMVKAGVFAWGGAMIPVGVLTGIQQEDYLADEYCFVAPGYGLLIGLLCPVALVILHNTITFALVAKTLFSTKTYVVKPKAADDELEQKETSHIGQRLLNAFSVSIILGLTWVFGLLAIEEARMIFQLLFCIFNAFQGVLIFILFCYAQKDVRRVLSNRCCTEDPVQYQKPKKVRKGGNADMNESRMSSSSSTRVTGEVYSDDNDTVVTNIEVVSIVATTIGNGENNNQFGKDSKKSMADSCKSDKVYESHAEESYTGVSNATVETDISTRSNTDD